MLELVNDGWVPYSFAPFQEDLAQVLRLVGTVNYETRQYQGLYYIRGCDDNDHAG